MPSIKTMPVGNGYGYGNGYGTVSNSLGLVGKARGLEIREKNGD